jgi:hypothetical protein
MESDQSTSVPIRHPSGPQVRRTLRNLSTDRAQLAERLAAPWWLYVLLALLGAGYVATPAIRVDGARNAVAGALIGASVVMLAGYRRLSGVRVRRTGSSGAIVLVGLFLGTIVLLIISYGLASLLSAWWVLAPATICFALLLVGGRWFDRLYREHLRRGH